ncbi:hypothetical protein [Phycicoccus sonneratiae]|uniref:Uncharacterized protein n=1 Tax=Phycicoccus sonneratiae TaxID=2807628 RepID=A0ABS2CL75_9MICO|nr:hypothetical protein [Phycicoccus sonneraticus]MBM6400632.1 hypothetical protein [Phycicoccus sonneraticus]
MIDLLAPDGLGVRADLTTSPPGRTIEIPAGSLLLAEREPVHVVHEERSGTIWRPSLYAAIVGKAAACALAKPERHLADVAALLAEVDDPFALRARCTAKDRQRLRGAATLDDHGHRAWVALGGERRERGHAAWAILRG